MKPVASTAPLLASLRRRVLSLGAANAFEYAMQFILPIILVRSLTAEAFGEYRLIWLVIMTTMLLVNLYMAEVLYFFLPRSGSSDKRLYVHQTLGYLAVAGALAGVIIALALGPLSQWLPASMRPLSEYGVLLPTLLVLIAVGGLLDILPSIEERVHWQAAITVAMALLRTLTLAAAAYLTRDLAFVIWMLVALMLVKLMLLLVYVARTHGLRGAWFGRREFLQQFRHAWPFGVSSALYGLRGKADQWVAASLFALTHFAAFSIAAVFGPMLQIIRQSVNHVVLPSMSRLHASKDVAGMVDLNSRANALVASIAYPLLAFAFAFAEDLITLIYTDVYVSAAPVMRVYILGLVIYAVELSSIMMLMRDGVFSLRLNLILLASSIALSWSAAQGYGLAGAAAGSTLVLYADRYVTLRRIAVSTGIRISRLQDWRMLGRLLGMAALAGGGTWIIAGEYLHELSTLSRLILGGAMMAAAFGALLVLSGMALRQLAATPES